MKKFKISLALSLLVLSSVASGGEYAGNQSSQDADTGTSARSSRKGWSKTNIAEPSMPFEDTKLVMFHFDPDMTYGVKTKENLLTHIEIAEGDVIKGFYPSDSMRWKFHISGDKRRMFVKPSAPGLFTSATLVTEKRVYEMAFISGSNGDDWYQRVTWSYPEGSGDGLPNSIVLGATGVYEDESLSPVVATSGVPATQEKLAVSSQFEDTRPVGMVDPSKMSFDYTIVGTADFKPITVFDDGRFTWLRFDKKIQSMPAIFLINDEGMPEVLNYTTHGDYILISRLVKGVLLRLGKLEVTITKNAKACGVMGC